MLEMVDYIIYSFKGIPRVISGPCFVAEVVAMTMIKFGSNSDTQVADQPSNEQSLQETELHFPVFLSTSP